MSATGVAVVAVDGSDPSVKALVWTLAYAAEHGLRVEVLTVWPLHGPVLLHEVAGHFNQPRWHARDVQEAAMARALAQVEEPPPYELTMDNGTVVDALRRARRRSAVVVIGAGRPGTHRRRRRRLSDLVRDYVPGPVVVVGPAGPVASESLPEAAPTAVDHDAMTVKVWRDQAVAVEEGLLLEFGDTVSPGQVLSVASRTIRTCMREHGADLGALEEAERSARRALLQLALAHD